MKSGFPFSLLPVLAIWAIASQACEDRPPRTPPLPELAALPAWPTCPAQPQEERWYRIRVQGRDAGTRHLQIWHCSPTEPGHGRLVVEVQDHFGFMREGQRIELFDKLRTLVDDRFTPLRIQRSKNQQGQASEELNAGRSGDEMVSIRGPDRKREPFDSQALDSTLFARKLFCGAGGTAVREHRFRSWSPSTAGYVENRTQVQGPATDPPGAWLILFPGDLPGMRIRVQLDETCLPRQVRAKLGNLRISWRQSSERPTPEIPAELPDFRGLMRLETTGRIANPDGLSSMTIRLHGLPEEIPLATLKGPGQAIAGQPRPGVLDLRTFHVAPPGKNAPAFPLRDLPEDMARWTAATALAQADDPRIRALARRLTADRKDAWAAALALRNWVNREIDSDMGLNFASASQVLAAGEGDCSEKAVLLTALARSVGIPARVVAGLVYYRQAFSGHMWTEVWVGSWLPLDAAIGPERVSPARIRLGVRPLNLEGKQASDDAILALLVSGVRVEVLSAQP